MTIEIREIKSSATYALRQQVMWPDKPIAFVILDEDKKGRHFGLFKGDALISIVSLFVKNNHAQFRKLATQSSEQGQGYGTLLLNHLMTVVLNDELDMIWCNARTDKASFYEKFGMAQTPKNFIREGIQYTIMEKVLISTI